MAERPDLQRILDDSGSDEITDVEQISRRSSSAARLSAGNLSQRSFGELLAEVYRWRSNGALLLKRDDVKKIVYFRNGSPIFVKSNLVSECLGRILLREKLISEADCAESLVRLRDIGRPQGSLLIEMGAISPHNLVYALQLQLQTKLFDIFRWTSALFRFDPNAQSHSEPIELDLTTAATIYEGIKRGYSDERVMRELGDVNHRYPVASPDPLYRFQEIGLDEEEATLLAALDGSKTVSELAIASRMPPANALKFLLAMREAQVIEFHEEATHEPLPTDVRHELVRPKPPADAPVVPTPMPPRLPKPPPRAPAEGLLAKALELRRQNHFEVLGISKDVSSDALRAAYLTLAREYHPDKNFSSSSAEVRELAAEIYARITAAYEALSEPEERARYVESLHHPAPAHAGGDNIANILAAEGRLERGKQLLKERRFVDAASAFREAMELYPSEGEFSAWLGWALYLSHPNDQDAQKKAIGALELAVEKTPGLEVGYLFLGRIHKARGRMDQAEREFERALKSNPDSPEALRELGLLQHR